MNAAALMGASTPGWASTAPLAELKQPAAPAHVLVFTETAAFRHTDAITNGTPLLRAALEQAGVTSEHTEDSSIFNDADLARFDALVMFQTSGDPWTAAEKVALEKYQRAGGGIVAIHNATDMRGNYKWWDDLIGSLMPGHAATGSTPPAGDPPPWSSGVGGLTAQVIREDKAHPSTQPLADRWTRNDEWYNFATNVRGNAHVLLSLDESTYDAGGNKMGYDHPISWCKPYDGGRAWVTGMGHFGAHFQEPALLQHIIGGVKWAAGVEAGDCGGTINSNFEKVALDENTSAPFALDVAPDGRVFFTELVRGQIRVYDPKTRSVKTAITLNVYSGGEDGLMGIALDPKFAENGWVYVYHAPNSSNNSDPANFKSRVTRFTVDATSTIDPASAKLIIEVPASREPDEPGHTGGNLDFDLQGNLLLGVGDDVNPHSEPSGGYAPLSERADRMWDARETSANTNDLRGKILRVKPKADGGYDIPAGNLFPVGTEKTRPEIYAMGFRNPWKFSVDPNTGWIGVADYAPDNSNDAPATRGPAGIVEYNIIKEPGNYGWPLCMGNNEPFRDVDYMTPTPTVGPFFDCAKPINDSIKNTGLRELPPAKAPDMWYGYRKTSVPAIAAGGGLAPMGGPFYDYNAASTSDTKFPASYDGKAFYYDWARNKVWTVQLGEGGKVEKVNPFMPNTSFLAPQSLSFGPDGSLYALEWGGGYGRDNPNSGIYRIDYINGSRSPIASATATPDNGQEPLTVTFSSVSSSDPEGGALTYAWDFDGNGTTDSTLANPTHQYTTPGVYQARLTVTDPAGKTGTTVVLVTVGNTKPTVKFKGPLNGGFVEWGDRVNWDVEVTDAEDTVDYQNLIVQPALGHDDHAHPLLEYRGKTGSVVTDLGTGHSEDMKVFFALDARYTDKGDGDVPALTGTDTIVLQPKRKEAEHADGRLGTDTAEASGDAEGTSALSNLSNGDWASYEPVNFTGIDSITFRVAAQAAGGSIELRKDSPEGALLGTATVPATGSVNRWTDVTIPAPADKASMSLFLVFKGTANFRLNFFEVNGKGLSPETRPTVKITAPTENAAVTPGAVTFTADATDAENQITKVEFFVDGQKIGEDTSAPYTTTWNQTTEKFYAVHAVATNSKGLTNDSRKVRFSVGESGVRPPWETFANVDAAFDKVGDEFTVSAAGADLWQAANEFGAVYLPGGVGENFVATVKVAEFDGTHASGKAGIIVRNQIPQGGGNDNKGYLVIGEKGNGEAEFMHDAGGNGQVNDSGEPVANGCGTGSAPTWLKVEKFGKQFSVYCSRNGTEWTQVGVTTTIPAATTTQDIGLFVVSHISGTRATAKFTNWNLDTDPEVPGEPEEPTTPAPGCAPTASDEFDGALNRARWTTARGPAASAPAVTNGALNLAVTNGDIDGANTAPVSHVAQKTPAGNWQATTKVTLDHDNYWQYAGLVLHVDDDNYTKLSFTRHQDGRRFVEFWTETNGSRTAHGGNAYVATDHPATIHLRLTNANGTLTGAYSTNGTDWTNMGATAPLKANSSIGLLAAGDTDAQNKTAAFDWFRVTPDEAKPKPAANDEFDGTSIDGCRWDKIHGWNSNRVKLVDGKLRIRTFDADISGADNGPIENLILQTPPSGDWVAETKMTAPLGDAWQLAGFMLFSDVDHYVKYDVVADNDPGAAKVRRVELRGENGGGAFGPTGAGDIEPPASATDTWWLRLTKKGNTYTGAISADGTTWVQSPGSVTVALSNPAIGLMGIGPAQAAPIDVDFEYFRIGAADTEAPVTTATASAQPGADGWYAAAPTITLAATDGTGSGVAKTEFAIDGGAWQTYTAPFVAPEGEHTIRYRSTDQAGLVEAVKELVIKVRASSTQVPVVIGGEVPGVLALNLTGPISLGTFMPGVAKDYTTTAEAKVTSSAGDARLTVSDADTTNTGKLVNGAFALPQALQVNDAPVGGSAAPTTLKAWTGPFGTQSVPLAFKQPIAEGDGLRRGTYSKTLTFTLSTTTP
ncbi:glucose/arabinose dehydrogenase [Solirubrobacter pauli]|uniref:Glucose/arabinose dehydrogenase n=1 Tax=Solirubrobacter pauli TaxID=166793 RepID=A0A660LKT7_9ACTN|nr:ThuA domain-containing protein [Solirubrobacter pauli]RKQ93981.1 glucose/arabinose dehydrogenase [Solirubrobacter pauli]